jgi:hypothetical protein
MRTDTELLNGLEQLAREGDCPGVIHDDNGHWAVSGDGFQEVSLGLEPHSIPTTFFVEAHLWRSSIREAINDYLNEHHRNPPE